jgi:carbon-monoxide dehydrogenase large subunit
MAETGIGAAVRRKEDYRYLTRKGNNTDDIYRPGQVYAYFVRSTRPHAMLKSINAKATKAAPGVVGVFTGDDLAADGVGGIPCAFAPDGGPMNEPPRPALAQGKVRFVGDMVAVVIAESLAQAKDAAELLEIDYEELPIVVSMEAAQKPGASEGCRRAA